MSAKLILGDCIERMAKLPAASVDSIVTDPPYELGFMGKSWDASGIAYSVDMWREAFRVLKPGGHLLAFGGSRTYHRMACAIEDAGFEVRDQIMWVYGQGFPKSLNVGKAIDKIRDWSKVERLSDEIKRARTAANLSLKEIGETTLAATLGQYGAWYHRGGHMFFETGRGLPSRPEWEQLRRVIPIAPEFDDVYEAAEREVIGTSETTHLAVAPGQGEDRPAVVLNITASATAAARPNQPHADTGTAARFFYAAKASKADRDEGLDDLPAINPFERDGASANFERMGSKSSARRNHHPTVKPTALMRYLCRLVTPPGGIVLDPFMGSGSTGKAAQLEGFSFIGIERDPGYFAIAKARIAAAAKHIKQAA